MRLAASLAALAAGAVIGDAGYLGSLTQGPSPALPGTGGTGVRMAAEDVFIRLESCSTAVVSAAFLFEADAEETVLMCYPIEVRTVFHALWDALSHDAGGESAALSPASGTLVWVDGAPVETFVLVQCESNGEEEVESSLMERYGWDGPGTPRGGFLVSMIPSSDSAAAGAAVERAQALLVCWEVGFAAGGRRLVEIEDPVRPTSDYSGRLRRIAYPLVTGATWSGAIGRGRISVTGGPAFDWDDMRWWSGVMMPPPVEATRFTPALVSGLEDSRLLEDFIGSDLGRALVWEFENFEPVAGRRDSYTYFPDIGDIGGLVESAALDGGQADSPWESSFVYLYTGPALPGAFMCIRSGGLGLEESPGGPVSSIAIPGERLAVLDRRGDWLRVERDHAFEGGSGWLEMHEVGGEGLVLPSVIPLPESYWDP